MIKTYEIHQKHLILNKFLLNFNQIILLYKRSTPFDHDNTYIINIYTHQHDGQKVLV